MYNVILVEKGYLVPYLMFSILNIIFYLICIHLRKAQIFFKKLNLKFINHSYCSIMTFLHVMIIINVIQITKQ